MAALAQLRIQQGGAEALLMKGIDLVVLKCQQGGEHEHQFARRIEKRGELIQQGFSAAGAEANKSVAAFQDTVEALFLFLAQLCYAEPLHGGVYIVSI